MDPLTVACGYVIFMVLVLVVPRILWWLGKF